MAVPALITTTARHLERNRDSGVAINLGNLTINLTTNFNSDVLTQVVQTLGGRP